uniref:RNA-directed DNA polymerase n=1 Tax=Rubus yellow net virus TaxID=198310 RepID=A0A8F8XBN9_9VIRU
MSRSHARLQAPPATERATSSSDSGTPTLEDQIRGYRRSARIRHQAQQRLRRTFGRDFRNTIERQLDPDAELSLNRRRRANLGPAEVLYAHNGQEPVNRVYEHYSELSAHVVDRQQDFRFIEEASYQRLTREGMQFIHVGMAMVRIQMLHRTDAGISALVVFRDTRWNDDRQVIGSMSVDMTRGAQLVYIIPNAMMSIYDFYNRIQVSIQTRGYGTGWEGGDSNMIITRSLVGRLTNTSITSFEYRIDSVTDYLASNGVACIPGQKWSVANRSGEWELQPSRIAAPLAVPTDARLRQNPNGNISLRFTDFRDQRIVEEGETSEPEGRPETKEEESTHYVLMFNHSNPRWDTLGQPSGKYDYMVRYDAPEPTAWPTTNIKWDDDPPKPPSPKGSYEINLRGEKKLKEKELAEFTPETDLVSQWLNQLSNSAHNSGVSSSDDEPKFDEADNEDDVYNQKTWEKEDQEKRELELQGWKPTGRPGLYEMIPEQEEEVYLRYEAEDEEENQELQVIGAATMDEPEMEYPTRLEEVMGKLKNVSMEKLFPVSGMDSESSITGGGGGFIPPSPVPGAQGYPPATTSTMSTIGPADMQGWGGRMPRSRSPLGYGRPQQPWSLPSAQSDNGCMLVLPQDFTLIPDVINRWESITVNLINKMMFDSLQDKADYVENLLGEREKETWMTWRMQYEEEYKQLLTMSGDVRNITAAIKRVFGVHDPHTGSVHIQNQAYAELERLYCKRTDDVIPFLYDYYQLAAKSGRMWLGPELSEKLFRKLPPEIGPTIEQAYKDRYPGLTIGVLARANFILEYLQNVCKQAALQRSLKSLSFCRNMPVPGYYEKKQYGIRKAKTYKGKPHSTHVKVIKNKYKHTQGKKCKCYLCGIEGHYARECPKKVVKPQRAAYFNGMGLDDNWDVVSVEPGEEDDDEICSISEGENIGGMHELMAFKTQLPYPVEYEASTPQFLMPWTQVPVEKSDKPSWRRRKDISQVQKDCTHTWSDTQEVPISDRVCSICSDETPHGRRVTCTTCNINLCPICARMDYGIMLIATKDTKSAAHWQYQNKDELIQHLYEHNAFLTRKVAELTSQLQEFHNRRPEDLISLADDLEDVSILDNASKGGKEKELFQFGTTIPIDHIQNLENVAKIIEKWKDTPRVVIKETPESSTSNTIGALLAEEGIEELTAAVDTAYTEMPKGGLNKLYNTIVEFVIPQEKGAPTKFRVRAVIDTGCTCTCINSKKVPKEALEEAKYQMNFAGVNSTGETRLKMKNGKMIVSGSDFYTPYIAAFPMELPDVDMLIGCNFLRAMKGGVRLEGTEVTIYKKVTTIQTTLEPQKISLLRAEAEAGEELERMYYANDYSEEGISRLKNHRLLQELKEQGYIGEEPMKHWAKNGIKCKLDIKNPDIVISSKPPDSVSKETKAQYQRHIDALLKIGVIQPSKSKHRTAAFITHSGTSIDPITKKEVRGKERMVFDYRSLNDNTHKDQYTLPGINTIISAIGNAKIFSKFDLKSGFHQVLMDEESIPWTAFVTPVGFYEWKVMPFGLANAPAVFQRKMDQCFAGTSEFIAVYIDDILVFSKTLKEHEKHLSIMLGICRDNGLVLSPSKMKLAATEIDFLGATIGDGRIKLQPHIIKKIAEVDDESLKTLKGLRSWLGVLNYARNYIPKCGTLLGPLYSKTSEHGDRRWHASDWALVKRIKGLVQNLPDLKLPTEEAYMIIETDGCMEGWGGVCKWKPMKADSASKEEICAYASGKFPTVKSTIDAEIFAVMESLEKFKIFYMNKDEVTIRTDCQAIITFYEKLNAKKPSRVRWLAFCDYITNSGVRMKFEHIKGKDNQLADNLSRLTQLITFVKWLPTELKDLAAELTRKDDGTPAKKEVQEEISCFLEVALRRAKRSVTTHQSEPRHVLWQKWQNPEDWLYCDERRSSTALPNTSATRSSSPESTLQQQKPEQPGTTGMLTSHQHWNDEPPQHGSSWPLTKNSPRVKM